MRNFEVINPQGKTVMQTTYKSCVPDIKQLKVMDNIGYKFMIDGEITSVNKIKSKGAET